MALPSRALVRMYSCNSSSSCWSFSLLQSWDSCVMLIAGLRARKVGRSAMASTSPLHSNVYPPEAHFHNTTIDVSVFKTICCQEAEDRSRPNDYRPNDSIRQSYTLIANAK